MKLNYKIIVLSIICGLVFWLADSILDYYLYYKDQTFLNLLILEIPEHEAYIRSVMVICFLLFGILISFALAKLERANITLVESQQNLKNQNDLMTKIMESLTYPFYVVDINDYSIKIANSAAYQHGVLSGNVCHKIFHKYEKPCNEYGETCPIELIKETKKSVVIGHTHKDNTGNPVNIELHAFPMMDDNGNVTQMIEYCIDVTQQRQLERKVQEEKERLAVTINSIGDGVISTDIDGRILLINRVAEELTGWSKEEAYLKELHEVFNIVNEETRVKCENLVEKIIKSKKVIGLANGTILISKDKTERIIADSGSPVLDFDRNIIGIVIVFRDVTIENRIKTELQKIDKLESIGTLAGGIAHDFNNILTSIMGNISLSLVLSDVDKIHKRLHSAEASCVRARDLTKQLLIFSKGGAPVKKAELISDFIRDSVIFALSGSKVRADFHIPDNLLTASIDEGLINQVINNLIINAVQAMPEGGLINVYAKNLLIKDDSELPLKHGWYIVISIEDHGTGIPKENLKKIFDPFFTTKQKGQGLGLSESYSIINKHNGHIAVESTVEVGTTFHIYLPISSEINPDEKTDSNIKQDIGESRILLMDDEDYVRETIAEMLISIGYKVTLAANGEEAIELYSQSLKQGNPYDAVILDLTIPGGMGGMKAYQKLKDMNPDIKAIVSSAYFSDNAMSNYKDFGFSGVISKPYKIADLSRVLDEVINGDDI